MSAPVRQLRKQPTLLVIILMTLAAAGIWVWRSLDTLISVPVL